MQMKQQQINHSRLYDDYQYSIVQVFLEERLFLCHPNTTASTAKKYMISATWKDLQGSETEYYNCAVHITSRIPQTTNIKLKGITRQKSL